MWNPSAQDVAAIVALKKSNPTAAKLVDDLMKHLGVAAARVAFYESVAQPDTVAKADAAAFAGWDPMAKAAYLTKAAGGSQRVPMGHRMAEIATPAESAAMAKRAPDVLPNVMGETTIAKGYTVRDAVALVKRADRNFLPEGHVGHG